MRAGRLSCGDVITKSTTLVADIGPCPADGIIIGADNIRLNLNGHTISGTPGPGDGNAAGIRLPFRTGVTITGHPGNSGKKGTVSGFDGGVFINGGSGNTIENLVLSDNLGPGGDAVLGDGIVLFHSANNRLINNLVAHNGPFDGIGVLGLDSNDNLIQGNTVEDTERRAEPGTVGGSEGTGILVNNFLDEEGSPRRGESIRNNDVIGNIVRRNDNSGISNVSNIEAEISRNTVEGNAQRPGEFCSPFGRRFCFPAASPGNGIGVSIGPRATEFTRVLISENTVTGNLGNGIVLGTGRRARENQVIGNTARGNGGTDADLPLRAPTRERYDLRDNNVSGGTFGTPRVFDCDANVWRDNVFSSAFPDCIYEQHGLTPPPPPPPDPDEGPEEPSPDDGGGPVLEDGPVLEEDGPVLEEDGPVLEEDGPVLEEDGPVLEEDGPVLEE
jgi:parallel beta-helix repeat protein